MNVFGAGRTAKLASRVAVSAGVLLASAAALAQENPSTPSPAEIGIAALPRDLSPWGMFLSADIVVKGVLIGLVFASFVTWTVALAKGLERHAELLLDYPPEELAQLLSELNDS